MAEPVTRARIAEGVIGILEEVSQPGVPVGESTSIVNDLGVDSLTMVRIDVLLRDRLGLTLDIMDLEDIDRVADLIEALATRGQRVEGLV